MDYGLEVFDYTALDEITPLIEMVWEEVDQRADVMPLDLDRDAYYELYQAGMLRYYTARTEGVLVGFIVVMVQKNLHSKGRFSGVTDVMYIKPEYRGNFSDLLLLVEEDLRVEGVSWFTFITKSWLDSGGLADKLGYKHYENINQKVL